MPDYHVASIDRQGEATVLRGGIPGLPEACHFAFDAAETFGRPVVGHGPIPRWVSVYSGDHLELSIEVVTAAKAPISPPRSGRWSAMSPG